MLPSLLVGRVLIDVDQYLLGFMRFSGSGTSMGFMLIVLLALLLTGHLGLASTAVLHDGTYWGL